MKETQVAPEQIQESVVEQPQAPEVTQESPQESPQVVDDVKVKNDLPEKEESFPKTSKEFIEKVKKYSKKGKKEAQAEGAKTGEETKVLEQKEGENAQKTVEEKPVYKLNPKFIALEKEYELPKWAQDAIKDPESEKEVKAIFEKAMGLDHVKMRNSELYNKHVELNKSYSELTNGVEELRGIYSEAVQSGNLLKLDDFFKKLQIPPQVVLNYALQRVQYEELPPEQKQLLDNEILAQRRAKDLEQQNLSLQNSALTAETQARAMQLNSVLAKPEIAQVVQAFDSQPGRKPGDFWTRVKEHGEYTWYKSQGKVDLSPAEAVQQVIALYGVNGLTQNQSQQAQVITDQKMTQEKKTPAVALHRDVPTIPTVTGKGTSPMATKPRSIEDLKKIAKDMQRG